MQFLERERLIFPPRLVPCLEDRVNGPAHMERGCLRFGEPGDVAEEELQPALQDDIPPP